ncbi:MAG: hypothetical protein O7B26_13740 [Planctomycetota bacterium]|nr:hypothetical protein [Planctomycetota bacterium]
MNSESNRQIGRLDQSDGRAVSALEDEEFFCPVCNYNLTGNCSGCCSECGSLFDRDSLIAAQKADAITLIPWDDPRPMSWKKRLSQTLRISLFRPSEFAFAFSVQPHKTKAGWFMLGVLVGYFLLTFSFLFVHFVIEYVRPTMSVNVADQMEYWSMGLAIPMSAALGAAAAISASAVWLWIVCPHFDGRRHFKPWFAIMCYASTHFLLGGFFFVIALIIDMLEGDAMVLHLLTVLMGIILSGLLGVFTIYAVIKKRTSPSALRIIAFVGLVFTFVLFPIVLTCLGIAAWLVLVDQW